MVTTEDKDEVPNPNVMDPPQEEPEEKIDQEQNNNDVYFDNSKKLLLNAVRLNFPDPAAPLALTCDASLVAMGATLEQFVNGCWRPLGMWSKSLPPDKQRWTSFRRETLAVQQALRYFHHDIAGRHIVVFSDCKALCHAFKSEV